MLPTLITHQYGYIPIMKFIDACDDIKTTEKYILKEIKGNIKQHLDNENSKNILMHIYAPRDPRFFPRPVIDVMQTTTWEKDNQVQSSRF